MSSTGESPSPGAKQSQFFQSSHLEMATATKMTTTSSFVMKLLCRTRLQTVHETVHWYASVYLGHDMSNRRRPFVNLMVL